MSKIHWGCCIPEGIDRENFENTIICTKCKKRFHYECISLNDSLLSVEMRAVWSCPECIKASKSKKNDSTPIRNVAVSRGSKRPALNSPPADTSRGHVSRDDIQDIVKTMTEKMDQNFIKMRQDMINVFNETLKPIKNELSQMNESMNFISSQYDDMKKANEFTQEKVKELEKENTQLKTNVDDLNLRLAQIEQQSRQCNIELQCVPEHKNENLMQMIMELGKSVGCELNTNEVLNFTRTAKVNRSSTRPRSIIVQLACIRLRDQILASTITFNKANPRNKLNSSHLGLAGDSVPVFVSEHLLPINKALHAAARRTAKEKGYKFVWIRNGKIFLRKSEESDYIIVRNMDMLKDIK